MTTRPPCNAGDCGRPAFCKGRCRAHYKRPYDDSPIRPMPTADQRDDVVARVMAKTRRDPNGCITFTGAGLPSGYGSISWRGRSWVVHRAVWTVLVAAIPDEAAPDGSRWTIDHLCSNRRCVNVGHLEMVSQIENADRAGGLQVAQRANRGPRSEHGTEGRYGYGCRCPDCRVAHAGHRRAERSA